MGPRGYSAEDTVQEQEQRQRELREKLAQAKIHNVQGLQDPDAIFGPVPDFIETRGPVKRLFFSIYDNLGTLLVINFFTFLCTLPLIYVLVMIVSTARSKSPVFLLPLLVLGLVAPPAWAAASSYCAKVVEEQMRSVGEFWQDYRRFALKAIVLAIGQWLIGAVLLYATGWYLGQAAVVTKVIGLVSLYALVFWAMAGLYVWPLMVRGYSWRLILRNAGVLVIAAPLRSAIILILLLIFSVILTVTGIGLAALLFGLWAMLPNQALVLTRERLEKRASSRTQQTSHT